MKLKLVVLPLFSAYGIFSVQAAEDVAAYYQITELVDSQKTSVQAPHFGPYVSAVSKDASVLALRSQTFNLVHTWDMNLPYTHDYGCFYASDVCSYQRNGNSEYPFGWSNWRDALRLAATNAYSASDYAYLLRDGETGSIPGLNPELVFVDPTGNISTNNQIKAISDDGSLIVGFSSAPFVISEDSGYEREFTQRAYFKATDNSLSCSLLPKAFGASLAEDEGGFSAAYAMQQQVLSPAINGGLASDLVVGMASVSFPANSLEAFEECQQGDDFDYARCPGFNTQAWAWDVSACFTGAESVEGFALADDWLNDEGDKPTYTAVAMAINASGVAVGSSTYALSNSDLAARARAVTFEPDATGTYKALEIPGLENGIGDFDSLVRHTWAVDINDNNIIVGNLRFAEEKGRNRPVEFFVYDKNTQTVDWPLRDVPQNGSNSEISQINDNNLAVGWRDAYGEEAPTINGTNRRQEGFIYDHQNKQSWSLTDLTCSIQGGEAKHPLYKITYANAITANNEVIATAYKYANAYDYLNNLSPKALVVKLTPNVTMQMKDASLCSDMFKELELPAYERKTGSLTPFSALFLLVLYGIRRRFNLHK